jgi:hypothetical protein
MFAPMATEMLAPSCTNKERMTPVFTCTPPVATFTVQLVTVRVCPTCGPAGGGPGEKVLEVTLKVQDPNAVVPVARAGFPSVPLTLGAVAVKVGVAAAVLV